MHTHNGNPRLELDNKIENPTCLTASPIAFIQPMVPNLNIGLNERVCTNRRLQYRLRIHAEVRILTTMKRDIYCKTIYSNMHTRLEGLLE